MQSRVDNDHLLDINFDFSLFAAMLHYDILYVMIIGGEKAWTDIMNNSLLPIEVNFTICMVF